MNWKLLGAQMYLWMGTNYNLETIAERSLPGAFFLFRI